MKISARLSDLFLLLSSHIQPAVMEGLVECSGLFALGA